MKKKSMDYTDFNSKDKASPKKKDKGLSPEEINKRWWVLKGLEKCQSIVAVASALRQDQTIRLTQYMVSARLYGNLPANTWGGISHDKQATTYGANRNRMTYNVCQSAVDTVTSKIGKNKPKPYFLTSGGDYRMKRKAQKLGKFIDGCFYENDIHAKNLQLFKHGCVFGTGAMHIYANRGRICAEHALPGELFIDDQEALHGGKPRQMHWIRYVDRMVLADMFQDEPDKVKMIMRAKSMTFADERQKIANVADMLIVIESWHLKSGPDAKDGQHVMVIDGEEPLVDEEYNKDRVPFAFFRWNERLYGYWGQGAIEQIQNIQQEINTLLIVIQRSMHLMGSFKVALENTSKIVKQHINNEIGTLLTYTKTPPAYLTPPIVQAEVYAHLQTLKNSAYEILGVSQLSAAAKKPDGLDSGKALREYNDIESDRFMTVGQAWEAFHLDEADLMISVAKDIYAEDKGLKVNVPGKRFLETIKWSEVDMDDDQYIMKAFPVSSLPDEPAGRLQTVQEYMQAGLVSPRSGRRLLDFPDLEQVEQLANSQEEWVNLLLENIVEKGEYAPPEPEMDLGLAKETVLQYLAEGSTSDLEEEKMDLLRKWNNQVTLLAQKASPPPMPQATPQANPAPAPTSPMIPNVNTPPQAA